ncbi:uncharacterized protein LOC124941169 [Impatiens glandulifera]|uniref:uncharacterized protein LOC124941169 n=1 Tax=Impatiens glandulifera TaxID=253017 RepID=UPI001FB0A7D9|nr:uncharacterized protein LOC124941169 [Impatiens glandulifera]
MKGNKATILSFAEKCKSILESNWQGKLCTIKVDAKGSKGEIYSSKVKYIVKKGKPYIWVPEKDAHNMNTIIDERGSLSVTSPMTGALTQLLRSLEKPPSRIALLGEVAPLRNEKAKIVSEALEGIISSERKAMKEANHLVSGIMSSSNMKATTRSESLMGIINSNESYVVYKFSPSSYTYIDSNGGNHEVAVEDIATAEIDPLSHFSTSLIDGINNSEARRKALILFCITHQNTNAKDAFMLSVDYKGFNVLGKILGPMKHDGSRDYTWSEFRFTFDEQAHDLQTFCSRLVEMEEKALKKVTSFSGLGLKTE